MLFFLFQPNAQNSRIAFHSASHEQAYTWGISWNSICGFIQPSMA